MWEQGRTGADAKPRPRPCYSSDAGTGYAQVSRRLETFIHSATADLDRRACTDVVNGGPQLLRHLHYSTFHLRVYSSEIALGALNIHGLESCEVVDVLLCGSACALPEAPLMGWLGTVQGPAHTLTPLASTRPALTEVRQSLEAPPTRLVRVGWRPTRLVKVTEHR